MKKKCAPADPAEQELPKLCDLVISMTQAYEDVSEFIEDRTYALCVNGKWDLAMKELSRVTTFFENMLDKNEENCRDLADIYILIGEVDQYVGRFPESIDWFQKAAVVADRYAVPYHNLATSYLELGDTNNAIKSLEQEVFLEPGNYFSRLRLADLYEAKGDDEKEEKCLDQLLTRDPDNILALHKLIAHYEKKEPAIDVELLRKRLILVRKQYSEMELVIRAYHLCREGKLGEALDFASAKIAENPATTVLYLLQAFVFGEMHQFGRKRKALAEFKVHCLGKKEYMKSKLDEFEHVFGKKAVTRLGKILVVSNPNTI